MNPGMALPHQRIVPIRRADQSGDSFIFTQFLDFSNQEWEDKVGYGTGVQWPSVAGERTAKGNAEMVETLASAPYSIAYVGISFRDSIARAGLGTARLENQNGRFLLPTPQTVSAAASMLDSRTPPDERLSLVFAPGAQSYPLINYEYAVVSKRQANGPTAAALRGFLLWAISLDGGNAGKYLNSVGFIALPDFIRGMSEHQIGLIGAGSAE
jgi:phosphate transport system substrate-binding protein